MLKSTLRRVTSSGATLFLLFSLGQSAWATVENLKRFKRTYPGKDTKYYSCTLCHQAAIGNKGNLNAYGLALQESKAPAGAEELTKQDLRAIEKADADGDGVSNLDEINVGTAPGDPDAVLADQPTSSAQETQPASTQNQEPSTSHQREVTP